MQKLETTATYSKDFNTHFLWFTQKGRKGHERTPSISNMYFQFDNKSTHTRQPCDSSTECGVTCGVAGAVRLMYAHSTDGHMHTIRTIDIGRHEQRAIHIYLHVLIVFTETHVGNKHEKNSHNDGNAK